MEHRAVLAQIEPSARARPQFWTSHFLTAPWAALLRSRARRAALRVPDTVFGLTWSGAMTQSRLRGVLNRLPEGLTEIYLHPATAGDFPGHAPGYRYADELAALTASSVIEAARRPGITLGGYSDFPEDNQPA